MCWTSPRSQWFLYLCRVSGRCGPKFKFYIKQMLCAAHRNWSIFVEFCNMMGIPSSARYTRDLFNTSWIFFSRAIVRLNSIERIEGFKMTVRILLFFCDLIFVLLFIEAWIAKLYVYLLFWNSLDDVSFVILQNLLRSKKNFYNFL